MSGRSLKIALAASVALNLFALAGGVAFAVSRAKVDERVAELRRPARPGPFREVMAQLEPEVRRDVRAKMRAAALAARPDFEAARSARDQAVQAAAEPRMDAARVQALLDQSRTAEMRGRARLEGGAIAMLENLDVEDRKVLSGLLMRRGPGPGAQAPETGRNAAPPPPGPDGPDGPG
ncbi:MAG: periplasmic heavy metal sensor [Brevundimonas sp.]|uniref:periplasmic heavy metal sensor n=1 Tax=Brevundimonas sp. TaxID=1871086 RepID=UPI00271AE56C|nr:periplasmic heavy metal sensor [Brevundimonas sp.]MDO9608548.1 periplasmic heavy metal sensor [Brevundimonas sp.]